MQYMGYLQKGHPSKDPLRIQLIQVLNDIASGVHTFLTS